MLQSLVRRVAVRSLHEARCRVAEWSDRSAVPLAWQQELNWGDALNPYLLSRLTLRPVHPRQSSYYFRLLAVGSVLWKANARADVWGSGFIGPEQSVEAPPRRIHAVRGPLSQEVLKRRGVACPDVYGDPAILLPLVYSPIQTVRYKLGIIPHYADADHPWILKQRALDGVRIIDVRTTRAEEFIDQVMSCAVVLTTSLHGLICADAYGVPSVWLRLGDGVLGGGFKFADYRCGIGHSEPTQHRVNEESCPWDLAERAQWCDPRPAHEALIQAMPYLSQERRRELIERSRVNATL